MDTDAIAPIAITGLSVKFPQDATSPEHFWDMLVEGRSAATRVPEDRFNVDAFYHPDPERLDALRVRDAHFMKESPKAFDASFFRMSPAEASVLDPQQRGLLEGAYHCLENAGVRLPQVAGTRTGVFVACFGRDYDAFIARDVEAMSRYHATGSGSSMLANRISHAFDLRGPSITVDTACSAGLTAFHLACQSVLAGESDQALVCGGNTYLTPESLTIPLDDAGFLSPDGRCYSFDHKANGYARGEGFGCVLIKLAKKAVEDGDLIRAVVRGTGINQDGRTPSITQPSREAQMVLIRETYASAGLDLSTTDYVEAHGTGTAIGDPIEAASIGNVFRDHREATRPLHVGSVKSNIGHLEGASGLAGVIKTVLLLEKAVIPPICNFERANPAIDEDALRIRFDKSAIPWPSTSLRRASVSSFGYGGSNGHAILEDAYNFFRLRGLCVRHRSVALEGATLKNLIPSPVRIDELQREIVESPSPDDSEESLSTSTSRSGAESPTTAPSVTKSPCSPGSSPQVISNSILVISAADESGPSRIAASLSRYLTEAAAKEHGSQYRVRDILHTLSIHRTAQPWRSFTIIDADLTAPMSVILPPGESQSLVFPPAIRTAHVEPSLVFVFTGQGAQWAGMGLGLLQYPVFRDSLTFAGSFLCKELGCAWDTIDELNRSKNGDNSQISTPAMAQPLCTILQICLVDLLASWGVVPSSVVGHSSGEIAAAYCAGAINREQALRLAYFRGVVSEKLAERSREPGGLKLGMLSVGLGEDAAIDYLRERGWAGQVSVGCVNSPKNVTLTGLSGTLDEMYRIFDEDEIFVRRLSMPVAYHSVHMGAVAEEYYSLVEKELKSSRTPVHAGKPSMVSAVTGQRIMLDELRETSYWVRNLVDPVRFSDALSAVAAQNEKRDSLYLMEIGPQAALRRPVQDTLSPLLGDSSSRKWGYSNTLDPKKGEASTLLTSLGQAWCAGVDVDIARINKAAVEDMEVDMVDGPRMVPELPSYPFDHSRIFWDESRLSKRFAFRQHRRHGLLGLRARDFNTHEASWRHIIRHLENPWILDHSLNGSPIYPGSGMIVMAIEGLRQITTLDEGMAIKGYRVRDVRFKRALDVDDSEHGVEAQLHLRQRRDNVNNSLQKWYDWRVFTLGQAGEWLEAAHGRITVEVESIAVVTDDSARRRTQRHASELADFYEKTAYACKFKTYPDQMYGNMAALGLHYGPYFARLNEIHYSRMGHATASLNLRDYAEKMPYAHEDPCVIHPTTLDALCHLQMAALSCGGLKPIPTMMFTRCEEMWVSHKLLSLPGNQTVRAASTQTIRGFRECEFDTVALLGGEDGTAEPEPVVVIRGERGTAITSLDEAVMGGEEQAFDTACYSLEFRPDLRLLDNSATFEHLMTNTFKGFALPDKASIDNADAIALHFLEHTMDRLERETDITVQPFGDHRDHYIRWMRRVLAENVAARANRVHNGLDAETLIKTETDEPTQKLVRRVGENLFDMLTGAANVHEVMFGDHLVDDYYSAEMFKIHAHRVGAYTEILAHANPYLKILEIGAGTGSSAAGVLPFLTYDQGNGRKMMRIQEYMYTDISAGFFEHARQRFSEYSSIMSFAKLDIEHDPKSQGFEENAYDVIIAGNVLHATSDLCASLRNVRRLLKPGGKLIMVEICNPHSIREGLIFGLLSGWWLRTQRSETDPESDCVVFPDQGPLLTEGQWADVLSRCGFSGVDLNFRDHEALPHHRLSTLVASADDQGAPAGNETSAVATDIVIVLDNGSRTQNDLAGALQRKFAGLTHTLLTEDRIPEANFRNATVVVLLELDSTMLHDISDVRMSALKKMSLESRRCLWVVSGGGPRAQRPEAELSIGFSRTVCSERGDQGFVVVSLNPDRLGDIEHRAGLVSSVLVGTADGGPTEARVESELFEVDGVLQIPRVAPSGRLNDAVDSRMVSRQRKLQEARLGSIETDPKPVRLTIGSPGLLDTLQFKEMPEASQALENDEVEIRVMASSINFKDVMIALGQIPGTNHGFGYDGAGVVVRTGPTCQRARMGDRVMFVAVTGAFATFVRVSELQTHIIPASMSMTVAASVPVVYCTALYSLDYVARLQAGETVLIHAGAGGVGQAAIQIAQRRGAVVYTTAGSKVKRNLLIKQYGIPSENIFNSRDASFAHDVRHATGGRGVDVVLNSLGGELLQQSWQCIKVFGRFVEIGKADILDNSGLDMAPFDRNVTFSAVDLIVVVENSKELMRKVMADVMDLWTRDSNPVHEPRPLHVYPAAKVEEAMRYLQSGKNTGKTVIDWAASGTVQFRPCYKPAYQFRSDATYVLAGGLGGLPRAVVRWMVSRGARWFLLLSRSGAGAHEDVDKFVREMQQQGATLIAPACNIAQRDVVVKVLKEYEGTLPPIKGCIQGAMVLHDELMEHMTAAVWNEPLDSKYHGSRNLAELLPADMDFLVLLSSFAGVIGNRGQSNYAAGNTYQDGLARHLVTQHKRRAVSVNLGLVLETGSANSNYFFVQSTLRAGFSGVTQEQLMALLDVVCDRGYDCSLPGAAQVVHVVDSPRQLWQKGHESVVGWMTKPLFRNLHRIGAAYATSAEGSSAAGMSSANAVDYAAMARDAATIDEAADIVYKGFVQKLAKSLSLQEKDIDSSQPAYQIGVDSLVAVEIRYWFMKTFGVEVAVFHILRDWSISELCASVTADIWKKKT